MDLSIMKTQFINDGQDGYIQEYATIIWIWPNYTMTELPNIASIHCLKVADNLCDDCEECTFNRGDKNHVLNNYPIIYANISFKKIWQNTNSNFKFSES